MKNRTPAAPEGRAPLSDFAPVPRRTARHDGWTPERQRAFVAALADTGSVSRAAAQVNMASEGAYQLRRQPGAEGFRAAWSAALDFGVARLKDIALERAVEGALVPVLTGGRLIGYRRVFNDRLLMFCLRHYGEDPAGKRTTINYFSTKAAAGSGAGGAAGAEASTTTVRTVITGAGAGGGGGGGGAAPVDQNAALLEAFAGVPLDAAAQAEIAAALDACAARRTAEQGSADDPAELFFAAEQPLRLGPGREGVETRAPAASGNIVAPDAFLEPVYPRLLDAEDQYRAGDEEVAWTMLDRPDELDEIDRAVASVTAARLAAPAVPVTPAVPAAPAPDDSPQEQQP